MTRNIHAIRCFLTLKQARVIQVLSQARDRMAAKRSGTSGWRGMTMFTNHVVQATDPRLPVVSEHYRKNLADVCRIAQNSGAKVILSTAACNLKDCPPFVSLHGTQWDKAPKEQWQAAYHKGVEFENTGHAGEALAAYWEAEQIDADYADLQFRLARCYSAQSLYDQALIRFIKARELDALRFRADTGINEVVKTVVSEQPPANVRLLDAVQVFSSFASHGIPGEESFLDHVHMTFQGRYVLAKAAFETGKGLLPSWVTQNASTNPLPDCNECAATLAYTGWEERSLLTLLLDGVLTVAPFTGQIDHDASIKRLNGWLASPGLQPSPENINAWSAQYRRAIARSPSDWWLHWKYANFILNVLHVPALAGEHFRQVETQMPQFSSVHAALGVIAGAAGEIDHAVTECREGVRLGPQDFMAHYYLGLMYEKKAGAVAARDADRWRNLAASEYKQTLVLSPLFLDARNTLAFLLWAEGHSKETLDLLRDGLRYTPDVADLHYRLGDLLAKLGQKTEAITELQRALTLNPNHPEARTELKSLE